ncbi:hypothetical protein NPS53_08980 [Pseudomonas putida]|uniref:hypothetical protein n=1 Tax=Pseudomonas putida TaxID=303 RepID=UPI0023636CF3|nr:hypothetical protein [Pseudomonas putida]MDD2139708.1 hypothetical protein [Pseudomonas putida]HDS1721632.1 hypothetical protein [Pseudomonas putida]
MGTKMTKKGFVEALVAEHKAARALKVKFGRQLYPELLSIEVDCHPGSPACRLVIRGNVEPMTWITYETDHPTSPEGLLGAHHEAVDIVYEAVHLIASEQNEPAAIGISSMKYYESWFTEPHASPAKQDKR